MPSLRAIEVGSNLFRFTDRGVVQRTLNTLIIPSTNVAVVENWLNATYIPSVTDGSYQMVAHVFSTNPLRLAVLTLPLGEAVPDSWWI